MIGSWFPASLPRDAWLRRAQVPVELLDGVDVAADAEYRPALACGGVLLDDAAMQHVGHAVRISR